MIEKSQFSKKETTFDFEPDPENLDNEQNSYVVNPLGY